MSNSMFGNAGQKPREPGTVVITTTTTETAKTFNHEQLCAALGIPTTATCYMEVCYDGEDDVPTGSLVAVWKEHATDTRRE